MVGNLQCLLTVVGLRNPQIIHIHTQSLGIETVESMLRIDECRYATLLLSLCNSMDCKRCFTRRLRTIYLNDTPTRITAHAERGIQSDTSRRNNLHILNLLVSEFHYRAFSEIFFYLRHCRLQRFHLLVLRVQGVGLFCFLCHNTTPSLILSMK